MGAGFKVGGNSSLGAIVAPTKENFEKMLATDKQIFNMLVTLNVWLFRRPNNKTNPKYNEYLALYQREFKKYSARQNDYRTNSLYKLGNKITEWKDKAVHFFSNTIGSLFKGLGDGGLVSVPVAIVIGATISVAALTYFIYAYFTETNTGYNALIKVLPELSAKDPELAKKIVEGVGVNENIKAESGFFSQIGKGAKIGITVAVTGIVLFGVYKIVSPSLRKKAGLSGVKRRKSKSRSKRKSKTKK
jgi:hypothetical protein